jgi:WD40 repeat protein
MPQSAPPLVGGNARRRTAVESNRFGVTMKRTVWTFGALVCSLAFQTGCVRQMDCLATTWDARTARAFVGREVFSLPANDQAGRSAFMLLSPNGRLLVYGRPEELLRVVRIDERAAVSLPGNEDLPAAFSPNSQLFGCMEQGHLIVRRTDSFQQIWSIPLVGCTAVLFSPDSKVVVLFEDRLGLLGVQTVLHAFDASSGQRLWSHSLSNGVMTAAVFAPSGDTIGVATRSRIAEYHGDRGTLNIVRAKDGGSVVSENENEGQITDLAYQSDGRTMWVATDSGRLLAWDPSTLRFGECRTTPLNFIFRVQALGNPAVLFVSGPQGCYALSADMQTDVTHSYLPAEIRAVSVASEGGRLVGIRADGTIAVWDVSGTLER